MEWFAEAYPWIPDRDAKGHALGEGRVSLSFVACPHCPAATDDRGHHVAYCRVTGCRAAPTRPFECRGVPAQV